MLENTHKIFSYVRNAEYDGVDAMLDEGVDVNSADDNGNTKYPTDSTWEATKVVPVYQGIDQSKLVPLLVKTIQELEVRIKSLEDA